MSRNYNSISNNKRYMHKRVFVKFVELTHSQKKAQSKFIKMNKVHNKENMPRHYLCKIANLSTFELI